MDFDIISQVIIVFFTGIIILILGKNISKVKETPDDFLFESSGEKKEKEKFLYLCKRLVRRVNKEKYQEKVDLFWVWFEKVLRKLRINFLRLDNKIVSALDKVKEKNVEAETETESKDQRREYDEPKDNDIKLKDENMYVKDEEVKKNDNDENVADNTNEIEVENKSDESGVKIDELNTENKNKNEREKEYIDLISKNPVDVKSYWKLGIVYSRRKNYKDAISCFRQITKIDPTYTKAKKKITDLMGRMKKNKKNSNDGN